MAKIPNLILKKAVPLFLSFLGGLGDLSEAPSGGTGWARGKKDVSRKDAKDKDKKN